MSICLAICLKKVPLGYISFKYDVATNSNNFCLRAADVSQDYKNLGQFPFNEGRFAHWPYSPDTQLGSMGCDKFFSGQSVLLLPGNPKFLGGLPKDEGECRDQKASRSGNKPVMIVQPNAYPQDEGRYSIPIGALIWGAILAFATYLGIVWTDYRHRKIVERYAPRDRDGNPLPPLKPR